MLDSAVTWFGITIENALQERDKIKMGSDVQYKPRYSLSRLLEQGFKLPMPPEMIKHRDPGPRATGMEIWQPLLMWAGKSNGAVKFWKYIPPAEEKKPDEPT